MRKALAPARQALAWALLSGSAGAAPLYVLQSEVWRNLGGRDGAVQVTEYEYDSRGNRVLKGVRPLADTAGGYQSTTRYLYGTEGRLEKVILLAGTDTSSLIDYAYDGAGNLAATRTRDKDGALRITDSLLYDGSGRLLETRRLASGTLLQSHVYVYDDLGRVRADTVYERQGSSFQPALAVLTGFDSTGAASEERQFRRVAGDWHQVHTVRLRYAGPLLSSRTRYHGSDGAMADSTAYAYDAAGNRVLESAFDEDRQAVHSVEFIWRAFGPGSTRPRLAGVPGIRIAAVPGGLDILSDSRRPIRLVIRDARGTRLDARSFPVGAGRWEFPSGWASGVYLAEAVSSDRRRAMVFKVP